MSDTHHKLIASIRFHTLAKFAIQTISWIGTICVLRLIDEEALGLFAIASVVFGYASLIYEGGLLEAIVQRPPDAIESKRSVFTLLLMSSLVAGAVLCLTSYPIAELVGAAEVGAFIRLLTLALIGTALGILPQAELMREMKFGQLAIISSAQALCSSLTTVTLAWQGMGAWSLLAGVLAGVVVRTALLNCLRNRIYWPTKRLRDALQYVRTSGQLIVDGLLWRWYTSLDVLLLGRWAGAGQLGHYSFGQQIANMPLEKISTVVNDVSLPAYSELVSRRRGVVALVLETIRMHAIVGLPICWGLASVAVVAVPLVFGEQWRAGVFPLIAFALIAPVRLMGSVETPAMTAINRVDVLVKTKGLLALGMTLALIFACSVSGVLGAALVWLLIFPFCYSLAFRQVLKALGLPAAAVIAVIRGPLIAAAAMAVLVSSVERVLSKFVHAPPILVLPVLVLLGVSSYLVLLRGVDRVGFELAWNRGRQVVCPGR